MTIQGNRSMKRVAADEFAQHAAEYLEGAEPVSIEKDGEIIGEYVPASNGHPPSPNGSGGSERTSEETLLRTLEERIDPESLALIRRLDRRFQEISERAGLSEEELATLDSPAQSSTRHADRDL